MSYDQLSGHVSDIIYKAISHARAHEELEPDYARYGVDGYFNQVVPPLFTPFLSLPDPAGFDPLINDLHHAMQQISTGELGTDPLAKNSTDTYIANTELAELTSAGGFLGSWNGDAAKSFKTGFVDPFPSIAKNQFILTAALKAGVEAQQAMWAAARNDIDKVAHATLDALDNADKGCCDKNAWTIGFTVLASIATVAAAFATAGGSLAITLTVVGAAAQVGAAAPPSGLSDSVSASGETALQIVSAMKTAIDALGTAITHQESVLSSHLGAFATAVQSSDHHGLFVPLPPDLASLTGSDLTGGTGVGDHD